MSRPQQEEFHAECGHLIPSPAGRAGQDVRCPQCHQAVRVPRPGQTAAVEPIALTFLYTIALIGGVVGAGLIYLVMFDDFDESELVTITPLWFFPIVFGLYGFASQRLLRRTASERTGALSGAARMSIHVAGPLAGLRRPRTGSGHKFLARADHGGGQGCSATWYAFRDTLHGR